MRCALGPVRPAARFRALAWAEVTMWVCVGVWMTRDRTKWRFEGQGAQRAAPQQRCHRRALVHPAGVQDGRGWDADPGGTSSQHPVASICHSTTTRAGCCVPCVRACEPPPPIGRPCMRARHARRERTPSTFLSTPSATQPHRSLAAAHHTRSLLTSCACRRRARAHQARCLCSALVARASRASSTGSPVSAAGSASAASAAPPRPEKSV